MLVTINATQRLANVAGNVVRCIIIDSYPYPNRHSIFTIKQIHTYTTLSTEYNHASIQV